MNFIQSTTNLSFNSTIEGNVGRFITPAGEVVFFQTRARLSKGDISSAARLTSLLTPAREALDVREMDFNQLLQRDLDDHRIAHELVPYILKPQETGPAFFPPILAALLPFESRCPKSELPDLSSENKHVDPIYPSLMWKTSTVGNVFRLQELVDASGNLDPLGQAILRWNDELAKLVIMDGQHRAMALLAIYRTMTNSWGASSSSGERYKSFYESKINSILKELQASGKTSQIEKLEFPVTLCIFPEYTGANKNPHSAARKLFVDVNKEAKPPSESRLILLSDSRLDHVLSRELLNHLKSNGLECNLPLFAVEYDNPEPKTSTPRRWSAVTNLEILLRTVDLCCFGPEEIVSDIDKLTKTMGPPNKKAKGLYFRSQLMLQDILDSSISDGPRTINRHDIGLDIFPIYNQLARKALLERFFSIWGKGFLRLVSEVAPYKAHINAVKSMQEGWLGGEISGDLAKEALFEGVGMFWTLERGHEHWREEVTRLKQLNQQTPSETEVSKAWRIVNETKRGEFEKERCKNYLGKNDADSIQESKEFYSIAITYAAQVGLALTWALLRHHNPKADPDKIVDVMIASINNALNTGPVQSRNRKLIFRREGTDPFMLLPKLDSSYAAYFRVFWLELLLISENNQFLISAGIDIDNANSLLSAGRKFYADKIISDYKSSYLKLGEMSLTECESTAQITAINSLAKAYHKWFRLTTDQAREIFNTLYAPKTNDEINDQEEDSDEGDSNTI